MDEKTREQLLADKERRRRERFITLLNDVTQAAISTQDSKSMLQILADRLGEVFDADGCYITLWDEAAGRTLPMAAYGAARDTYANLHVEADEPTLTRSLYEARRPLPIEDVYDTPYLSRRIAELFPDRSLLGLPLIADERYLGAALIAYNQPHRFSPDEIAYGEQVAAQIALAVVKAQLWEAEHEQRALAEALVQAAAALNSTLDFDQVLSRILEQALNVVGGEAANVMLIEGDHARIVRWQGYERFGSADFVSQVNFYIPELPNLQHMLASGEPIIIPDTAIYPGWVDVPVQRWLRSFAGAPIRVRDQIVGFLNVDSAAPGYFTPAHARSLQAFASHAASAIENARLYQQAQQEIAERKRAEAALRESEERFRQLSEATVEGVVLIDEGKIVAANQVFAAMFGYEHAQVIGMEVLEFVAPEFRDLVQEKVRQGYEEPYESICIKQDGTRFPIEACGKTIPYRGRPVRQTAIRDLTARKQIEEALRRRAEELAALHATSLDLTGTRDLAALLRIIIERAARLLDATGGGLYLCDPPQVRCVASYNTPQDYTGTVLKYGEGAAGVVAQTGKPLIIDDYRTWSGRAGVFEQDRPFRAVLSAPMIWQGKVTGVIHVLHDVETRRFTQADLDLLTLFANQAAIAVENARLVEGLETKVAARTAEIVAEKEKNEAILRSVGEAIAMADIERRIQYVNVAFTSVTGYTAEEAIGQRSDFIVVERLPDPVWQLLTTAMAKGKIWQGEATLRRKDGRTYDAAINIAPLRDAEGRLVGYVTSHRDVSQRKALERARSQFLANVSHQLRTPVTNLKLYAHLLQRDLRQDKAERHLQVLAGQIDQLNHLVQDIVDVTLLDSGQALTDWDVLSLPTLTAAVVAHYRRQAITAGLSLSVAPLRAELPTVRGDPERLSQALSELVENAIQFTPPGGQVTVEMGTATDELGRWATVAVRDSGPGITPEEQERVLERFFRGKLAESGTIPGTGVGLSIAYEIARAHGGRLTVASTEGVGSTFTLWLPAM